jgi:hypothetical protein
MSSMDIGTSLFIPKLHEQLELGYMADTKGREEGLNRNEIQNMYVFTVASAKAYERVQANWDGIAKDL